MGSAGLSPTSAWLSKTFALVTKRTESPASAWRRPLVGGVAVLSAVALAGVEMRTSWAQAHVLSATAAQLKFSVASGASPRIHFPDAGPYDRRLGYSMLPAWIARLQKAGYKIEQQARISDWALALGRYGVTPVYREKDQAGLQITDQLNRPLYSFRYPARVYSDFESVPPAVIATLLFIENRHLLDDNEPYLNPAIEWGRLGHAAVDFALHEVDHRHSIIGGSTLATQLEKLRHSPEGRTSSPKEKLRQIASASLRVYQDGPRSMDAQRRVILDYINSIPLSATPGEGEVSGLGDGLAAWYGADFREVNRLLAAPNESALSAKEMDARARAYRQVLSLLLALREPSRYLVRDPGALAIKTDRYLRALSAEGVISTRLRDRALAQAIWPRSRPAAVNSDFVAGKASQAVRVQLLDLLGVPQTYLLDRVDLEADTTIRQDVQQSVTQFLQKVADPTEARAAGLQGDQLLPPDGATGNVIYSFTLYEAGVGVNYLRAQTDNLNQPLNINDGTKLQLGSTAKLRTLITYLQIVEELCQRYASLSPEQLPSVQIQPNDQLTAWAIQFLSAAPDRNKEAMLRAAMERTYSASPNETFFTAGGQHTFQNFEKSENVPSMTVRQGFQMSVNLVFIRLMRDIENYYKWRIPGVTPALLSDPGNPLRAEYLKRFADAEGSTFLSRFYSQQHGQSVGQTLDALIKSVSPAPWRVAVIYRSVLPNADFQAFCAFLKKHVPEDLLEDQNLEKLYLTYAPGKFNLQDRGYLARLHPLELWLASYLAEYPSATLGEALRQSAGERQEVYQWLMRPKERRGQDLRIGIVLEQDAFREIWKGWKAAGYPFDSLVASYATSIGVSGDTPSALATLAGVIANHGMLYPSEDIRKLTFASGTPMETVVAPKPAYGKRVISAEVADLVHEEMLGVVENGTARRALHAFTLSDGTVLPVAGKTGTGDNRFKVFRQGHDLVSERPVNRTATFVFIIGDRLFGTVTAFVPSQDASSFDFTSALAVQVLKDLAPRIEPLLESKPPER